MNPLPLNSVFSSHGIRAMIEPGQNCLPDCFIAGKLVVFLSLSRVQPVVSLSLALPLLFDLTSKSFMPGHTNMGNLASLPLKCISQISSPSH